MHLSSRRRAWIWPRRRRRYRPLARPETVPIDRPPVQLAEAAPRSCVPGLLRVVRQDFCIADVCQRGHAGRDSLTKRPRAFSTYHGAAGSIRPSREGTAARGVPRRTLLAGTGVRRGSTFPTGEAGGVRTSCASCRSRSSSIIGATAAALRPCHAAITKPLQWGPQG